MSQLPSQSAQRLAQNSLRQLSLGETLPPSPHAVFCSLPTIADIIAYEKNDPQTCQRMQGGYPRFVNPGFSQKLENTLLAQTSGLGYRSLRLVSSVRAAEQLFDYLPKESQAQVHREGEINYVSFIDEPTFCQSAREFLQHTGCMVFSRQAEDLLYARGELEQRHVEDAMIGHHQQDEYLAKIFPAICQDLQTKQQNIFLSRCGMNAVFAAYQAINKIQKQRGRRLWIQLGWLYVDTIELLKKFSASTEDDYIYLADPLDLEQLKQVFVNFEGQVAAVITEAPTNPLLATTDTTRLTELCKQADVALILDPSLAGIGNVAVLEHCDLVVSSLTKYHGWSGDLIMGLAAPNPESQFYTELCQLIPQYIDQPYVRDLGRLAFLLGEYPSVLQTINQNTMQVADFLSNCPAIKRLYWAYADGYAENYTALAQASDRPGAVLGFELHASWSYFYDRVCLPKGPSFGTAFSILCPFVYLAHYDLVKTASGQDTLKASGLSPELLRLSVGIEPVDDLLSVLKQAMN